MISQLDLTLKPQKPKLQICRPDKSIVGNIKEAYNTTLKQRIIGSDELSFRIPYKLDKNHSSVDNDHISLLKNKYLVKLTLGTFTEWFIIENPQNTGEDDSDYLDIQTFSLEYELSYRFIHNYHVTSILLSDIVNIALTDTPWTLGSVPSGFTSIYRSFDISSQSVLAFLLDIATTYGLIVLFDTNTRQVNFYNKADIGENKGLTISETKYLKTISDGIDNTKFCTRLKMFGKNDLTFNQYNPTGQDYLEDYTYFIDKFTRDINKNVLTHSDYWSDSLCQAQLDYQVLIQSKTGDFNTLISQLTSLQSTLTTQQNQMNDYQTQLKTINDNIALALLNTQDASTYYAQKATLTPQINTLQTQIDSTNSQISSIQSQITTLQNTLALSNNFTSNQLKERNQFIIEQDISDNNYIDAQDLYQAALDKLEELKIPPIITKIDIINFLESITEQKNWGKIVLGDQITVKHSVLNINILASITEVNFDFEQSKIDLVISNIMKIENEDQKFARLLNKSTSVGKVVDINQPVWTNAQYNAQTYTDSQVRDLNQSVVGLATNVNIVTQDGYVTYEESQTLENSLNQLNSESTDIINSAILLGVSGKTEYQTALTNLQTELNNWIGQSNYPIYITASQRANMNTLFQNVQNTKSLLLNAQSEQRNTNLSNWGIESGGAISYANLTVTVPLKTSFVSCVLSETVNFINYYTIAVSSTSGFASSGTAYFLDTNGNIGQFHYNSIDAQHFYTCGETTSSYQYTLNGQSYIYSTGFIASIKPGTDIFIYPTAIADITISQAIAVNDQNQRFIVPAKTFSGLSIDIDWSDSDGWQFRYVYIDTTGQFNIASANTGDGFNVYPPNPPVHCIRVGYMLVGFGNLPPDGTFNTSSKNYNADGTPIWQIIVKQDFRYRDDKLIQYYSSNIGVNTATYDSTLISATVSPTSYYTVYIPVGISKRMCEVSITSSTNKIAADNLRQGAKFTVGRKPGGGSSVGIKLVSGVYVDASGYATHVDQKRNSTSPAYGDYIIPPTSLNANYTTIYDMDLMPYPSDPTQICLKIMFYNYYSSAETVNLRFTWMSF